MTEIWTPSQVAALAALQSGSVITRLLCNSHQDLQAQDEEKAALIDRLSEQLAEAQDKLAAMMKVCGTTKL